MRLLLINGNTTPFVTETAAVEARRSSAPDTEIVAVTASRGPRIIATRFENVLAGQEMIRLAAAHSDGIDGVLVGVSFDTALGALRELMPVPVVGMTEAALATAMLVGGRIGLVSLGARVQPLYAELVDGYGLAGRIAGWRSIEAPMAYAPGDTAELDALLVGACEALVGEAMAEIIVLLGAVMAGVPRRLQPAVPVPLVDGIAAGVGGARSVTSSGVRCLSSSSCWRWSGS